MNVDIGTEAAQFLEKEFINRIFIAVRCKQQTAKLKLKSSIYGRPRHYSSGPLPSPWLFPGGGEGGQHLVLYLPTHTYPSGARLSVLTRQFTSLTGPNSSPSVNNNYCIEGCLGIGSREPTAYLEYYDPPRSSAYVCSPRFKLAFKKRALVWKAWEKKGWISSRILFLNPEIRTMRCRGSADAVLITILLTLSL